MGKGKQRITDSTNHGAVEHESGSGVQRNLLQAAQKFLRGHAILESIIERIHNRDSPAERFISQTSLEEVWTSDNLRKFLNILYRDTDPDIVHYVSSKLVKTLSILVIIKWDQWTRFSKIFLEDRNGRGDDDLPFTLSALEDDSFLGKSFAEEFFNMQYTFLPIIIKQGENQIYSRSRPLPFIKSKRKQIAVGGYGAVTKEVIARDQFNYGSEHSSQYLNTDIVTVARKRFLAKGDFREEARNLAVLNNRISNHNRIINNLAIFTVGDDEDKGSSKEFNILLPLADTDLKHFLYDELFESRCNGVIDLVSEASNLADAVRWLHGGLSVVETLLYVRSMDIKLDTILVFLDQAPRVGWWKITDFGISTMVTYKDAELGVAVSPGESLARIAGGMKKPVKRLIGPYSAPEVVTGDLVGPESDIWSFGCVLFQVLVRGAGGIYLLNELDKKRASYEIGSTNDNFYQESPKWNHLHPHVRKWLETSSSPDLRFGERTCVDLCKDLITKTLQIVPADRPTAERLHSELVRILKLSKGVDDDPDMGPFLISAVTEPTPSQQFRQHSGTIGKNLTSESMPGHFEDTAWTPWQRVEDNLSQDRTLTTMANESASDGLSSILDHPISNSSVPKGERDYEVQGNLRIISRKADEEAATSASDRQHQLPAQDNTQSEAAVLVLDVNSHPQTGSEPESTMPNETLGPSFPDQWQARTMPLPLNLRPGSDSGYEGSSQIGSSFVANFLAVPLETEPLTNQVDAGKGVQKLDIEANDRENRELEDDIRSITSIPDDIQSQTSSNHTPQEWIAEQNLWVLLAKNEKLKPVYEDAISKLGKNRFIKNLTKLLKQYYLDLSLIAKSNLERATANLLRSNSKRMRICQNIANFWAPDNEEDMEERVREIEDTMLDLEGWIAGNTGLAPPEQDLVDQQYWDFEDNSGDDDDKGITELPNITQMENFLLTCGEGGPFRKLEINLRVFLFPASLGPLTRVLMSIPSERVWFSEEGDKSFTNRMQSFFEDITEESWNWWPLQPRMRALQKDQIRLHWTCHCNKSLWIELSKSTAASYRALIDRKGPPSQEFHLCRRRLRKSLGNGLIAGIMSAIGSSAPPTSILPTSNQAIQLSRVTPGQQSGSTNHPAARAATSGSQPDPQTNTSTTANKLVVLFGVKGNRRTLELAQIGITKNTDDDSFFGDLRREYRRLRGFLRYWLSIWQLRHCDFVKFKKIGADRIIFHKNELPEDNIYEYAPRPPNAEIPPVLPHEFELALTCCGSSCKLSALPFHDCIGPPSGTFALDRIPKRKGVLNLNKETRESVWGLQAQYSISFILMVFYHFLIFVGTFGFWAWWQVTHPNDLQNASTPLTVVAVLISLFWSSSGVLKVFREPT